MIRPQVTPRQEALLTEIEDAVKTVLDKCRAFYSAQTKEELTGFEVNMLVATLKAIQVQSNPTMEGPSDVDKVVALLALNGPKPVKIVMAYLTYKAFDRADVKEAATANN